MKERIIIIDILRGISIFCIILGRFFNEWLDVSPRNYGLFKDVVLFFATVTACFFLIISGIGYHIFINKRIYDNKSKTEILIEAMKRALFIFFISTLFLILFGFIFDMTITNIFYWSIFQVIAISMILFFSILFLKQYARRIIYISLIIIFFLLDAVISYFNLYYLSILHEGAFPFIPWTNFYIFGLLFGDITFNWSREQIKKKIIISFTLGILFILSFLIWISISYSYYYMPHFFPFFAMVIGIFIMVYIIGYFYIDIKEKKIYFQNSIIRWGRLAFSIYYINWGIVAVGNFLFPLIVGDFFSSGFMVYQYIILMALIVLSLEIFIRIWERYNFFLGIEWFMNKISKRTLFTKDIHND